jgi:hypothetical protein
MKVGDLIRHISSGGLGIVLRSRMSECQHSDAIYNYIDLVWLDDGTEDRAFAGLFEVVSESR